jgi:hypothetical protein
MTVYHKSNLSMWGVSAWVKNNLKKNKKIEESKKMLELVAKSGPSRKSLTPCITTSNP